MAKSHEESVPRVRGSDTTELMAHIQLLLERLAENADAEATAQGESEVSRGARDFEEAAGMVETGESELPDLAAVETKIKALMLMLSSKQALENAESTLASVKTTEQALDEERDESEAVYSRAIEDLRRAGVKVRA